MERLLPLTPGQLLQLHVQFIQLLRPRTLGGPIFDVLAHVLRKNCGYAAALWRRRCAGFSGTFAHYSKLHHSDFDACDEEEEWWCI